MRRIVQRTKAQQSLATRTTPRDKARRLMFRRRDVTPATTGFEADRILAVASTGHGASLAYMDRDGNIRCSQLERWTNVKHMMMFARDEYEALQHPKTPIDEAVNYVFTLGFGTFPPAVVFEDTIEPWFRWLVRDLDVGMDDIDLVVTSDGHFATGWSRLGGKLHKWFPHARISSEIEHHEIHQRQAFWPSGLAEAAVLTMDTCGEDLERLGGRRLSGTIASMNQSGECKTLREFFFPEMSSGTLYSGASLHLGFMQGQEGKTMGLAPYGRPDLFEALIGHLDLHGDGGFAFLDAEEFSSAMAAYVPVRTPDQPITERHEDVAFAAQNILELIVENAWRAALELTGHRNIVFAGGVALNSVANEKSRRALAPERMYIPPNPGDPGHALGCALYGAYEIADWVPPSEPVPEYLGPHYSPAELRDVAIGSPFEATRPDSIEHVLARSIANGHIVARFDGGAEFGPRALGNRSILCDPRRPGMKDYLNLKVKHREPFRPFAPSVLESHAAEWFALDGPSPYMLRVVDVRPDRVDLVPSITHVDGTARVQTVSSNDNDGYWRLISTFHELTGVPMVLNTSFNLAGKPIVETPQNALTCFSSTEIDILALGDWVVSKQPLDVYLSTDSGA